MANEGINDQSTITFSGLTTASKSATDQETEAWLIARQNAMIANKNAAIEEENGRRAAEDPPLDPLPLVPTITTLEEALLNAIESAWRVGGGSYTNQCFNEDLEASNQSADGVRRLDANEVLAGRSTADPSSSTRATRRS